MRTLFLLLLPFLSFGQIKSIGTTNQTYIGGTLQFNDAHDGGFGTWSSNHTSIATINSTSGRVTGVARGTDTIFYVRSGVRDSLAIYVSTSDSSGYYFKTISSKTQLQLRDCDGVTKLAIWNGQLTGAFTGFTSYDTRLANYIIGFTVPTGLGSNYMISIPAAKIKDFNGTAPQSTADSVMSQISNAGF